MPKYEVMVCWKQAKHVAVEAESLDDAVRQVMSLDREEIDRLIAPGAQPYSVYRDMSYLCGPYDPEEVKALVLEEQYAEEQSGKIVTVTFYGRKEGTTGTFYDITEEFNTHPMIDMKEWLDEACSRGYEVERLVEVVS